MLWAMCCRCVKCVAAALQTKQTVQKRRRREGRPLDRMLLKDAHERGRVGSKSLKLPPRPRQRPLPLPRPSVKPCWLAVLARLQSYLLLPRSKLQHPQQHYSAVGASSTAA